jgi:hypothetical protein
VSSPRARYSTVPDIRVRPVSEMDVCLVYTPGNPKLYALNPTAWLVMELCDGRGWTSLERRYYATIEPLRSREAAKAELECAVNDLVGKGIVEITLPKSIRKEKQRRARRRHN